MQKTISEKLNNKNVKIVCFDEVDSTNSFLRRQLDSGETGNVLAVAKKQTAGRGRSGKSFFSPENSGLYMSVLIHPELSFGEASCVTSKACVAVSKAIETVTGMATNIKWVNDLYLDNKKVCGILCEAFNDYKKGVTKSIIIGVGVNLSTADFPDELNEIAGSLGVDNNCFAELAGEIANALLNPEFGSLTQAELEFYRKRSLVIGKTIYYIRNGQKNTAEAVGIDSSGGLVVKNANGEIITLTSGEISVRLV